MTDLMCYIRRIAGGPGPAEVTDRQLLERYTSARDEAAFQAIVERHGAMVLGVCRRMLPELHDAEDAFQATFLVFVRKAKSIARAELLGNWLYGVAYRVAGEARGKAMRWQAQLGEVPDVASQKPDSEVEVRETQRVLDQELARLPRKYRVPVVLCYLEGKTTAEAARELGWPRGTVFSRLARARELLRSRLTRRGLATCGAISTMSLAPGSASAAVPNRLLFATVEAANVFASGKAVAAVVSPTVVSLTEGVLTAMFLGKLKIAAASCLAILLVVAGAALLTQGAPNRTGTDFSDAVAEPVIAPSAARQAASLNYGDGQADGKKSLGGSGEMVKFTLPAKSSKAAGPKVVGLKIHGSRYGQAEAPKESFLIFFLNHEMSDVVRTEMAPYSLFDRKSERWVEVKFRQPIEVPNQFWVALDFRAGRTKGVYVSYDTSTGGQFSRVGLPGIEATQTDFGGDWMIEVLLN